MASSLVMMRAALLFVVLSLGSALRPDHYERAFSNFAKQFHKTYATSEESMERFGIFKDNVKLMEVQNKELRPYKLGITEFSDRTAEELRHHLNGQRKSAIKVKAANKNVSGLQLRSTAQQRHFGTILQIGTDEA